MKTLRQSESGSLLAPFVIVLVLFLGAVVFAGWAFTGRQDYKNKSDQKSAIAAAAAVKAEDIKKDAAFAESEKSPVKSYLGSSTYGSVSFQYPKTWSAYLTGSGSTLVDGYFSPDIVPDISSGTTFALRIQVLNAGYTATLKSFDSLILAGQTNVSAFRAAKVPGVLGTKITGQISTGSQTGILILLPVRDKTVQIWTEGNDFANDFNNTVLPSLSFIP